MRLYFSKRVYGWLLLAAILVGAVLRFSSLTDKPVWMDEVITAIFSLGRNADDVTLEASVPVSALAQVFSLRPDTTCSAITRNVSQDSTHPPLFFCGLHAWLQLWPLTWPDWVWKMRALSALMGTVAIALAYGLNYRTFSSRSGLLAAWLMALSPFAVYLSQEARHYMVPMIVMILALIGLLQIQADLRHRQWRPWIWLGWIGLNSLGFYLHYFCVLATIAQVGALSLWLAAHPGSRSPEPVARQQGWLAWGAIALATVAIGGTYVPWLPIFLTHLSRPETSWMQPFQDSWQTTLAPLYQLPVSWISMIVAFPVENQPLWCAIPMALAMILFTAWIGWCFVRGMANLLQQAQTYHPTVLLGGFVAIVILEFLGIAFVFQKDITQAPRYAFLYYPAVCALLAASLLAYRPVQPLPQGLTHPIVSLLVMGFLSCQFVNADLAFQKPFYPDRVASQMAVGESNNTLVTVGYDDFQDIALGLSFALELQRLNPNIQFAFLSRSQGYKDFWQQLATLPAAPHVLWVIAPDLRQRDFAQTLVLGQRTCHLQGDRFYRIGIPYQGYTCR
jgi:uncharacterized membrane protein